MRAQLHSSLTLWCGSRRFWGRFGLPFVRYLVERLVKLLVLGHDLRIRAGCVFESVCSHVCNSCDQPVLFLV